jgi:hypothetical protein
MDIPERMRESDVVAKILTQNHPLTKHGATHCMSFLPIITIFVVRFVSNGSAFGGEENLVSLPSFEPRTVHSVHGLFFPERQSFLCTKLSTDLYLISRLRMTIALLPVSSVPSCHVQGHLYLTFYVTLKDLLKMNALSGDVLPSTCVSVSVLVRKVHTESAKSF